MDRVGAQARQAPRAEPAAARRNRYDLHRASADRPPAPPPDVRYVITLDADTRMPRDTARRLVGQDGASAQPAAVRCRVRGAWSKAMAYCSRASRPSLPTGREGSLFQRIFSSPSGIDPYAAAVSDVYQDLFGEGSYTGKGIYDVDAFEAALAGRVPESTLLEPRSVRGHLRPRRPGVRYRARRGVSVTLRRRRRAPPPLGPRRLAIAAVDIRTWRRIPPAIGALVRPGSDTNAARMEASRIPLIGRWKMLDNLRRSLSAPASVAALLAGWALPLARRGHLDRFRPDDDRPAAAASGRGRDRAATRRTSRAQPVARPRRRGGSGLVSDRAGRRVPRAPGVADGGRDRRARCFGCS